MINLAKKLIVGVALLLYVSVVFAETVARIENETAEAFAERMRPPQTELVHKVIESNIWGNGKKTIFMFYAENAESMEDRQVVGYVYLPITNNTYRRILIDTFHQTRYHTTIESVFFGNADKDADKVLGIIVSSYYALSKYSGNAYGIYIYKAPAAESTKLEFLKDASDHFGFQCECEGPLGTEVVEAEYKTAAKVKAELKWLGL